MLFFFFQAEDGIRGLYVTGVQTCALPILLVGRAIGDGGEEALVDRIERAGEPIDRIIAGEHAALYAENRDRVADDRSIRLERPRQARATESGDLDRDVLLRGHGFERAAPGAEPVCAAIGRKTGVIDDDLRGGKVGREL